MIRFIVVLLLFAACEEQYFKPQLATPISWSFHCDFPEKERNLVREGFEFWQRQTSRELFVEYDACNEFTHDITGDDYDGIDIVVKYTDRAVPAYPLQICNLLKNMGINIDLCDYYAIAWVYDYSEMVFTKTWLDLKEESKINVAQHEIGHVLGFFHHSSPECLMYGWHTQAQNLCGKTRTIFRWMYSE